MCTEFNEKPLCAYIGADMEDPTATEECYERFEKGVRRFLQNTRCAAKWIYNRYYKFGEEYDIYPLPRDGFCGPRASIVSILRDADYLDKELDFENDKNLKWYPPTEKNKYPVVENGLYLNKAYRDAMVVVLEQPVGHVYLALRRRATFEDQLFCVSQLLFFPYETLPMPIHFSSGATVVGASWDADEVIGEYFDPPAPLHEFALPYDGYCG